MPVRTNKRLVLDILAQELRAAGFTINQLATSGRPVDANGQETSDLVEVLTYDATGAVVSLPSTAQATVDAHTAGDTAEQQNTQDATNLRAVRDHVQDWLSDFQAIQGHVTTIQQHNTTLQAVANPTNAQVIAGLKQVSADLATTAGDLEVLATDVAQAIRGLLALARRSGGG